MLASSLLTFREGLEAALIVAILVGYLRRIGRMDMQRSVWAGVGLAVAVSVAAALGLQALGAEFQGQAEQLFEGTAMLLAAGILTWMVFWMRAQGRQIKGELEAGIRQAVDAGRGWGLFSLAFVAVVREGLETALFLTAAVFTSTPGETLIGGLVGLAAAVAVGWVLVLGTARLDVARFFQVTSALLVVFAAGLVGHAVHEYQEAGLLPIFIEHLWSTKAILDDNSAVGSVLRSLVGYNDDPSLLEVIGYIGYYVALWVGLARRTAASGTLPGRVSPSLSEQHGR